MQPAGIKAFAARTENRSSIYAYEQRPREFEEPYRSLIRKDEKVWTFFQAQPPGYRKMVIWWVVSAKREETRSQRLKKLIQACRAEKRL
jgi:uncharacterized protein YdeI (YjbR/CyaY-like superfamily)